ncbi:hypothetical protein DFH06DRAFT_1214565 [Mycena polygramma]|nr:hypothetical protein DFH06DRAFT_1214565 [Mycena polygramma]
MASVAVPVQLGIPNIESPWIGMLSAIKDTRANESGTCELCGRETHRITKHHLYPRAVSRKAAARGSPFTREQTDSIAVLCWPCHCIIHRLIPGNVLAASFHSVDLLMTHVGVQAWLHWALLPGHSVQHLHSFMIPPKVPKTTKAPKTKILPPPSPSIQRALDTIWAENQGSFPKLESKRGKTRGHALRCAVRQLMGNGSAIKPTIRAAMAANPEYLEWQQWVFGPLG